MLTCEDKELLKQKGITEEQIAEQLACFEKGFPFLQLAGAASVDNNGIMVPDSEAQKKYLEAWDAYMQGPSKIVKFVPASGAASRMFKNMFEFLVRIMMSRLQTLRKNSLTTSIVSPSSTT